MRNVFLKDGLFDYCTIASNQDMTDRERKGRQVALSAINGSVKDDVALKLLKCYTYPYECWSSLKSRYESDSIARQMSLIDKFFSIRKNGSMDAYLLDMKEAIDQMEEVEVGLPEKVIVYHTLPILGRAAEIGVIRVTAVSIICAFRPHRGILESEMCSLLAKVHNLGPTPMYQQSRRTLKAFSGIGNAITDTAEQNNGWDLLCEVGNGKE